MFTYILIEIGNESSELISKSSHNNKQGSFSDSDSQKWIHACLKNNVWFTGIMHNLMH